MEETTDVGPLALEQGLHDVEELVADALAKGATVLCGGERLDRPGWFYPADGRHGNHRTTCGCSTKRCSGPSPSCSVYATWTRRSSSRTRPSSVSDRTCGHAIRRSRSGSSGDVEAGAVFVNGMTTSYSELPFGGVKESGYGRELDTHGIREFCNIKTVWVDAGT